MGAWPVDLEWGSWVLGDLADVLHRVADLVGRAGRGRERGRQSPRPRPAIRRTVLLIVAHERDVYRMHTELTGCEYPVTFLGDASETGWTADVAGARLEVALQREPA